MGRVGSIVDAELVIAEHHEWMPNMMLPPMSLARNAWQILVKKRRLRQWAQSVCIHLAHQCSMGCPRLLSQESVGRADDMFATT